MVDCRKKIKKRKDLVMAFLDTTKWYNAEIQDKVRHKTEGDESSTLPK
jgi:hypothetical protein